MKNKLKGEIKEKKIMLPNLRAVYIKLDNDLKKKKKKLKYIKYIFNHKFQSIIRTI